MQDDKNGILLEDIQSKLQLLLEVTGVLANDMSEIKPQVALIPQLAADTQALKAVQTDQGRELGEQSRELHHIKDYLVEQGMPQRA